MLKAEGTYILPDNVPANEFLNLEGNKLSTSKNWAVWLHEYLQDFPDKQDVLRYALTANAPETKDNDFTWKDFQARNNNELAAVFGNFINRVVVLTNKYYNGIIPVPNEFNEVDTQVLAELKAYPAVISSSIERYRFREAQGELMNVARLGNKYLADEEPWKMVKTNPERVQTQMYVALQIASVLTTLCEPFLPFTSKKLTKMLNIEVNNWNLEFENWNLTKAGHQIGEAEILFTQIEDAEIQKQIDKLEATKKANVMENQVTEPQKLTATFDDFAKLDLRVGTKVEAEKILQQTEGLSHSIVRTIIVYGQGEQLSRSNLILWAKEALQKGSPLQIVNDQFRAPTWADDLAWACVRICELSQVGIFHIAGPEVLSIYDIVERVAAFYKLPMEQVSQLSSDTLQQPAKRPARTGFVLDKAQEVLGYQPHTLEQTFALL
jgi:valyl-tRNA synthetase